MTTAPAQASFEDLGTLLSDLTYVVVDLEFPDAVRAAGFLAFLEQNVWSTPANSPALAGSPTARVLEDAR